MVVSVVVPITAPWGEDGILDAETLATATAPTGVLTGALDEVLATTATVALDPMIPASIRLLGSAAPESAVEWLDRLEAGPDGRVRAVPTDERELVPCGIVFRSVGYQGVPIPGVPPIISSFVRS